MVGPVSFWTRASAALLVLLSASIVTTAAGGWREDLAALASTLRSHHPKLLHPEVLASFDQAVAELDPRLETMDRPRAVAALARLVSSLHDGHTQIGLTWDDAVGFRRFPLRVYLFSDGVFIRQAASTHADLLGTRVEAIGSVPIDSAIERLRPWVHGDNDSTFRDIVASRLVLAELLAIAGITDSPDSAVFHLRRPDGNRVAAELTPLARDAEVTWMDARDTERPPPLYLRDPDRPYWFVELDALETFWLQFNAVTDAPDEPLEVFAPRALAAAEGSGAERLVIDIRRNNGGDNTLLRPLVVGLIRSRFNEAGRLYVVTGRLTFSAAMNFATQLERYTEAIFVGEPTGAPPNHYGETQQLVLPYSGITVLYSSLYWQDADPRDERPWIAPSISAPLQFADFRDSQDPALEAILAHEP